MMKRFFPLILLLLTVNLLTGCGLKGEVKPPKDGDPAYPRTYPPIP